MRPIIILAVAMCAVPVCTAAQTRAAQTRAAQTPAAQTPGAQTPARGPAAKKPAAAASAAGMRTIEITAGDDMKYSVTTISAKRGEQLRIRLKSVGTMPKIAMAHNVVVLKPTTDAAVFTTAAASARATNFVPPQLKSEVIAASGLAGNGETVDLDFKVPATAGKYPFVCTFPGHFVVGMKGTLIVK